MPPFSAITLLDLKQKNPEDSFIKLNLEKDPDQRGFIIATTERTDKPTDENWTPFGGGELKVFKDGELYYNGKES